MRSLLDRCPVSVSYRSYAEGVKFRMWLPTHRNPFLGYVDELIYRIVCEIADVRVRRILRIDAKW